MSTSRRNFLTGLAGAGFLAAVPHTVRAASSTCPFRLSVINDEISPDFDHACSVAANDFGLSWIELRSMWGKNVTDLNAEEVDRSRQILDKYKLRVTDIASPLFKVHWPGAPMSKEGPHRDEFHAKLTSNSRTQCSSAASSYASLSIPIAFAASISGGSKIQSPIAPPSTISCARPREPAPGTI